MYVLSVMSLCFTFSFEIVPTTAVVVGSTRNTIIKSTVVPALKTLILSQLPAIKPVARYGACEITWHIRKQPVVSEVSACGVVPVAATVLVSPAGTCWHYRGTTRIIPAYYTVKLPPSLPFPLPPSPPPLARGVPPPSPRFGYPGVF